MRKLVIRFVAVVALATSCGLAAAQSTAAASGRAKPIHDGITLYERVSRDELNRLHIVDGRIKMMHFKTQELEVTKDEEIGQAFFTPKTDKTISVFITTESGATFTLVLQPVPKMPAANVVVQEMASTAVQQAEADTRTNAAAPSPMASMSFEQAISTLIFAAATNQQLPGVSEQQVNQTIPLWEQSSFVHVRTLSAAGMHLGEYKLTNVSQQAMRLVEQELYKPGVLAIAVEHHTLAPGESTPVFVVVGGSDR